MGQASVAQAAPGYGQLIDAKTGHLIDPNQIVYNQVERICLQQGDGIPAIQKLADNEHWKTVPLTSYLNQVQLGKDGKAFERSNAWEFDIGPQRFFVAMTPQPAISLLQRGPRASGKGQNKCELKALNSGPNTPYGLKTLLIAHGWALASGTANSGVEIYSSLSNPDREVLIIYDMKAGHMPVEVVVM